MRRLARRLFTLCSAVSLLLCVAVCVFWVRSYRTEDRLLFSRDGREHALRSFRGRLAVGNDHLRDDQRARFAVMKAEREALWAREEAVDSRMMEIDREISAAPAGGAEHLYEERRLLYRKLDDLYDEDERNSDAYTAFLNQYSERLGDGFPWSYGVPHAVLAGVLLLFPGARLAIGFRAVRRRSKGLCPACGYDLRASPARCPECGAAADASVSGPKKTRVAKLT